MAFEGLRALTDCPTSARGVESVNTIEVVSSVGKMLEKRFIHRGSGLQTKAVQEAQATYGLRAHESRARNVREGSSIGAMDERTRTVHKASTHCACCVAANGASVKGHSAIHDVDAPALHPEKEMSIQRGDGGSVQESSEGEHLLLPEDQVGVA